MRRKSIVLATTRGLLRLVGIGRLHLAFQIKAHSLFLGTGRMLQTQARRAVNQIEDGSDCSLKRRLAFQLLARIAERQGNLAEMEELIEELNAHATCGPLDGAMTYLDEAERALRKHHVELARRFLDRAKTVLNPYPSGRAFLAMRIADVEKLLNATGSGG